VNPDREAQEERRRAIASRIGFDAYGMTPDMPDPVAHAINHMLDHIQKLDEQVEALRRCVTDQGIALNEPPLPELEPCQLDPCVDKFDK
jgi:serine O-acetyltransferase